MHHHQFGARRPAARLAPLACALALAGASLGPALAQAEPAPPMPSTRSRAPVTLNFVNAEVESVSRAVGAMLDRQIFVDPRVKGQITLTSDKPQVPAEAWRSYLSALRGMGATVVENAGLLKVVPEAEAKVQSGTVSAGAPTQRGDTVLTQIFRLNHENPNNLVAVLRPLISANNTITANVGNSSLVITDYADNLQRIAQIIAVMDQPAGSDVEVVTLKHALAVDLAPLVQKLLDAGSGANVPGAASPAGGTTVIAETRSNAIIVRAPNPIRLAAALDLVTKLDRPQVGSGPAGNIWVVHLKNADAIKLAEVLRAAMAGGSSGGSSSAYGASNAAQNANRQQVQAGGQIPAGGPTSAAATTPVAASAGPSTGGMIQADPATNSLIISAPEPLYRQMRDIIDKLDGRRKQVHVESMIVKVDAEKAAQFGVQWQGLLGNLNNSTAGVAGTNFGSSGNLVNLSLTASGTTTSTSATTSLGKGLNVGVLNKINGTWTLGALANLLQTETGANILSTPTLVALDNEEAKIVIGQNVPFVTGSFTNTGTGNGAVNPFQTVERKDVGITLRIRSQIGEGGTVRMTVYQESSSLRADNSSITDKSSIETTVVVDDGQTLVLGGLLKDEFGDSVDKVPGLGDVPWVGGLFRNEGRKRTKSNLMLFLRPVVLPSAESGDRLTLDRYDSIRAQQRAAAPTTRPLLTDTGAPELPALPGTQPAVGPGASGAKTGKPAAAGARGTAQPSVAPTAAPSDTLVPGLRQAL